MSVRTFLPGALQFLVLCTMFLPAVFENFSLAGLNVHPGHSKTSLYSREKSLLTFVFYSYPLLSDHGSSDFSDADGELEDGATDGKKRSSSGVFFVTVHAKQG